MRNIATRWSTCPVQFNTSFQTFRSQRTVEVPTVQFVEDVVDVPMDMAIPSPTVEVAQKTVAVPDVEIPMVMQRHGSNIQAVQQTADVAHEDLLVLQQRPPSIQKGRRSIEVSRVMPHERMLRPAGELSSSRSAKHMATVAGPRTAQGDRQREHLESDVEQDACTSVDESLEALV